MGLGLCLEFVEASASASPPVSMPRWASSHSAGGTFGITDVPKDFAQATEHEDVRSEASN